jgi:hypothetical protein
MKIRAHARGQSQYVAARMTSVEIPTINTAWAPITLRDLLDNETR